MHPVRKPALRLFLMFGMFSMLQCCCCIIPIRWRVQNGTLSSNPPAYVVQAVEAVQNLKEDLSGISLSRSFLPR
jgi:hypothetical protein